MTKMPLSLTQHTALIAFAAASLIGLAGCGAIEPDSTAEGQEAALGVEAGAPVDAAVMQRVTAAWQYAVGGDTSPTTLFSCADGSKEIEGLSTLREALAASLTTSRGACTATSQGTATIGGRTVGVYKVSCEALTFETARSIWNITSRIEACWPGAGARWRIGAWNWSRTADASRGNPEFDLEMSIDPEPVSLIGSLSGPSSWAAVYYTGPSGSPWAYQVPGTWYPSNLPAGAPCATYAAPAGTLLTTVIQASAGYRVCR